MNAKQKAIAAAMAKNDQMWGGIDYQLAAQQAKGG